MQRWFSKLTLPWGATARRTKILAEADRQQDDERKAAVRRVVESAREWDGPTWGGPIYRVDR